MAISLKLTDLILMTPCSKLCVFLIYNLTITYQMYSFSNNCQDDCYEIKQIKLETIRKPSLVTLVQYQAYPWCFSFCLKNFFKKT